MLKALSQELEFRIYINSKHATTVIRATVGDVWRTPRELTVFHQMVKTEHNRCARPGYPLTQRQNYHGVLHANSDLHCFAIAGGALLQAFEHLFPESIKHALLNVMATEPDSHNTELVAHRLRHWNNGNHNFEEIDIVTASDLVRQYWEWRTSDGPRGMWKMYTMAAVFAQNMFRRNRPQVPSVMQREIVQQSLFRDRHAGLGMDPLLFRIRVLAMEMHCNIFIRPQVYPSVSCKFAEPKDTRTCISGYSASVSLPFAQAAQRRMQCPTHFARGETLLYTLDEFTLWFKSQYMEDLARGTRYLSNRNDCPDGRLYRVFNRRELYTEWLEWLGRMVGAGKCSTSIAEIINSADYTESLRYTMNRLVSIAVAPGLYETTTRIVTLDDGTQEEVTGPRTRSCALFKRKYPLNDDGTIMTPEERAAAFPETAEERVQREGMPLLAIAEQARRTLVRKKRGRPKKKRAKKVPKKKKRGKRHKINTPE